MFYNKLNGLIQPLSVGWIRVVNNVANLWKLTKNQDSIRGKQNNNLPKMSTSSIWEHYITLQREIKVTNGIQMNDQMTLKIGRLSWIIQWDHCNHKGSEIWERVGQGQNDIWYESDSASVQDPRNVGRL